jgi:hypothetical protein
MRKLLIACLLLLATAGLVYAAAPTRIADRYSEGKTDYGAISVQGMDDTASPGYIEFRSGAVSSCYYYLWVNADGLLCLSEREEVNSASFPGASWKWHRARVVGAQTGTQDGL